MNAISTDLGLLFRVACAQLLEQSEMVPLLCLLVEKYASNAPTVQANGTTETTSPKWLVSVLILLDLYEKAVVALNRRTPLLRLSRRKWKWFEERSGKWSAYSPANNQQIDEAYVNGLQRVRFAAGRRKYIADFTAMVGWNSARSSTAENPGSIHGYSCRSDRPN